MYVYGVSVLKRVCLCMSLCVRVYLNVYVFDCCADAGQNKLSERISRGTVAAVRRRWR